MGKGNGEATVPYACFVKDLPVDPSSSDRKALPATGRCRIHPSECKAELFREIVAKNQEQARVELENEGADKDVIKKQKKKFMKEGNALASKYLEVELGLDLSVIDVEVQLEPNDLVETDGCLAACMLDVGSYKIVTDGSNLEALDAAKIPRERLVASFSYAGDGDEQESALVEAIEKVQELVAHVSLEFSSTKFISRETVVRLLSRIPKKVTPVIHFDPNLFDTVDELCPVVQSICSLCQSDRPVTVALTDPTARQLGLSFAACTVTDRPDGMYTTVVVTRNNEALGLVYSSAESIVAALECGRGVYYSRSRNSLWRKGDTSGHFQVLHRLDIDCDGDAIRFTVTQMGEHHPAFCHLNRLTCWGQTRGLRHLEETLRERVRSAPEGSYTKRLLDDPELLRDKLVEEAQELSEAQDPQHVAEELADVLYFALTMAAKAGVGIDDAVAELDKRSRKVTRRKGDSKAFRIAAGKEILDKKQQG